MTRWIGFGYPSGIIRGVPVLHECSIDDRKRLLELFPVAELRHTFQAKGTKEEICYAAAADASPAQIERVTGFLDSNFGCCKQHVYVLMHEGGLLPPQTLGGGERVLHDASHGIYVTRISYTIMLRDPLEETTLDFLWPMRVDLGANYVVVRFVVLEKNVSSYFERQAYVAGKSLSEKNVLSGPIGTLQACDLNKGIKKLWADGYIESTRSNFKKPFSTSSETMDEERGIKEYYPELYSIMQEAPLYTTLFQVNDERSTVKAFSIDPSHGIVGFSSYSGKGDTDGILEKIISNN